MFQEWLFRQVKAQAYADQGAEDELQYSLSEWNTWFGDSETTYDYTII